MGRRGRRGWGGLGRAPLVPGREGVVVEDVGVGELAAAEAVLGLGGAGALRGGVLAPAGHARAGAVPAPAVLELVVHRACAGRGGGENPENVTRVTPAVASGRGNLPRQEGREGRGGEGAAAAAAGAPMNE